MAAHQSYEEQKQLVFYGLKLLGIITIVEVAFALFAKGHIILQHPNDRQHLKLIYQRKERASGATRCRRKSNGIFVAKIYERINCYTFDCLNDTGAGISPYTDHSSST